jgi:RimJ/RimL family protein N-acetyltransferase
MNPIGMEPLEGTAVRLPLVTTDEAALMLEGRTLDWFAAGYPRQDDLDAVKMVNASEWSVRHVVRRADGLAVGTIGFFGPPDADGRVEVGYGLVQSARGQGLMTDALSVTVAAAEAADVQVIAHTAAGNIASQRTLARCGFIGEDATNADGEQRYARRRPGRG